MGKEVKTNAMRILDRNKIPYEIINYECDEFIDGLHTAEKTGAPVEQSFKTLVMQAGKPASGGNRQYYVFVVPIAEEVDLKAAAKCVGEKSLEMLHVKDLTPLTGYVRGGCSPLGMKKQFPTVVHESAASFDKIYISGGRVGTSITVNPDALLKVTRGQYSITKDNSGVKSCEPPFDTRTLLFPYNCAIFVPNLSSLHLRLWQDP